MQKRTLLAAVATAAITAIATPSISQAQNPQTSKGEVAMQPNFGSLMSAINATSDQTSKLKTLTTIDTANVQLVNVADLLQGNDTTALNNALQKHEADIATLRTTLGGDSTVSNVLTTNTVPLAAADIVAADVATDGKVTLFYWKKSE